ncbi:MAG: response regulator [Candidatus Babeliaceae bacterium]|nr:response regulator [Candidatus Babeliaceae bacterium]
MAKKILVIDDDPTVGACLKDILGEEGYEVLLASGGREGIKKAEAAQPDLIITDFLMEDISGGAVAKYLHDDKKTSAIPLIFITTMFDRNEAEFAKHRLGSYEFLAKPVQREELLALVKKMIG